MSMIFEGIYEGEVLTKLSAEIFVYGKSLFAYKTRLRNLGFVSLKSPLHKNPGEFQKNR